MHDRRRPETVDVAVPVAMIVLGVFILIVGVLCWNFETTPGLDHTLHACAAISYVAVMGSMGGLFLAVLGALLLNEELS